MTLDILNKEHAYIIGLLQSDGNLSEYKKNKGKITLELNKKDKDILEKISTFFDCYVSITERCRNINIKKYQYISNTVTLSIFDLNTRNQFKKYLPPSKKSDIIKKPENIIENDYWRGIIDGDGSLGFTKNGLPFISLVTCSDELSEQYINYLTNIIGYKKETSKNKRDNAYNIMVTNEDSQKIISQLYYDKCLSIDRKYETAKQILNWVRPSNIKKIDFERKKWSSYDDEYIIEHDIDESMEHLNRTEKSIKTRLYRLKTNKE